MSDGESHSGPELRAIAQALLAEARVDGPWSTVAVGWATVDLERASAAFDARSAHPARFAAAPDSALLGARARIGATRVPGAETRGIALVLLEPSTEGRLAASLARHGEGPAAIWLDGSATSSSADPPRTSPAADGPFGLERLVLGGPVAGPHVLLLGRPPGTIDR